jgi:hypothetical protein
MRETRRDIDKLRARLLPAGTTLKDAPPEYRGLSWEEYEDVMLTDCATEARRLAVAKASAVPAPAAPKLSTKRDSYGWRSLPGGSSYYGEDSKPKKKRG